MLGVLAYREFVFASTDLVRTPAQQGCRFGSLKTWVFSLKKPFKTSKAQCRFYVFILLCNLMDNPCIQILIVICDSSISSSFFTRRSSPSLTGRRFVFSKILCLDRPFSFGSYFRVFGLRA